MRALALDIALKCGYAVLQDDSLVERRHGVFDMSEWKHDLGELGNEFHARLCALLQRIQIDYLVIERPIYTRADANVQRLLLLSGLAEMSAQELGVKRRIVPPTTWRKAILGRGNLRSAEAKRMAKDYVRDKLNVQPKDDNHAEAILIGLWWARHGSKEPGEASWTGQRSALKY